MALNVKAIDSTDPDFLEEIEPSFDERLEEIQATFDKSSKELNQAFATLLFSIMKAGSGFQDLRDHCTDEHSSFFEAYFSEHYDQDLIPKVGRANDLNSSISGMISSMNECDVSFKVVATVTSPKVANAVVERNDYYDDLPADDVDEKVSPIKFMFFKDFRVKSNLTTTVSLEELDGETTVFANLDHLQTLIDYTK